MDKAYYYNFKTNSVSRVCVSRIIRFSESLPESEFCHVHFFGSEKEGSFLLQKMLNSLTPVTNLLYFSLFRVIIDTPLTFPESLKCIHIGFDRYTTRFPERIFECLPVSLEILSICQYVPIDNPTPSLKIINLDFFSYTYVHKYDDAVEVCRIIADKYFTTIPSLCIVRFGPLLEFRDFSRDLEKNSVIFTRKITEKIDY